MLALAPVSVIGQEEMADTSFWAFSAFFGSGWYRISDNRSVLVLRAQPRQTLRAASFDEVGGRTVGIEISYPLTAGLHNIEGVEDLPDLADFANFGTISLTPGIQFEIPVNADWTLRALAHAGWGTETSSGNSAWITYGGVKSRYTPPGSSLDWSLLSALKVAAYWPDSGPSQRIWSSEVGAEWRQPIRWQPHGQDLSLNWHLNYRWLMDDIDFSLSRADRLSIGDQWEFGLALGRPGQPWRLGFVDFEHIGLAYSRSSDGDYRAITLNLSSLFNR